MRHQNNLHDLLSIRGFSDGGSRNYDSRNRTIGMAACGWLVQGGFSFDSKCVIQWEDLCRGSICLGPGVSAVEAELTAIEAMIQSLCIILSIPIVCGNAYTLVESHTI